MIEVTTEGRLRFANTAAQTALGLNADDEGVLVADRLGLEPTLRRRLERYLAVLAAGRRPSVRLPALPGGPPCRRLTWCIGALRDRRGRLNGYAALGEAPTGLAHLHGRIATSEERLAHFAAVSTDWFWETDVRHRFTYLSEGLEAATGISRGRLLGHSRLDFIAATAGSHELARHLAEIEGRRPFSDLTLPVQRGRGRRLVRLAGRPFFAGDGRFLGYRGVGWEPGSSERTAERVRFLARHDPLTGLVNRQALDETLQGVLKSAAGTGDGVALYAVDLEDFKRVNENHGHRIGDLLLQHAADRLRRAVAGLDTVARLGGDEFAVMLRLPQPVDANAVRIGERIAGRLRQPFKVEGHEINCGVRIGVTWSPTHGNDASMLLQQADLALHEAKRRDDHLCVFGAEINAASERRKSIERRLNRALEQNEMSLVLQPQFAIASRRLVGAEALLRWRHGQPDEIGPGVFVPIAEETGLIVELGSWVLREACRLAAGWWRRGQGPRLAVNLSPVQFWNRDLCGEVEAALAAFGLPPAALELEITEGVLMRDTKSAAETLNRLNELGVAIALDDFGTGYSSLSYLKRFPIHRLKIDQTFVRDLDHDQDDRQIARAIVGLGHSLGLEVIAEGVETERHLRFLAELECDVAQGYLFAPPLTVPAFAAMLEQPRGRCGHHAAARLGEAASPLGLG